MRKRWNKNMNKTSRNLLGSAHKTKTHQPPQRQSKATYQSEAKTCDRCTPRWKKSPLSLFLLTKSQRCCQFFGGERYMGLISKWANENKLWVLQNNSWSQLWGPAPSLKTDKIILSGWYLEAWIEETEYVLFNMCSPPYLHLSNVCRDVWRMCMTFSLLQCLLHASTPNL